MHSPTGGLSKTVEGKGSGQGPSVAFKGFELNVRTGDKIAFVGREDISATTLFKVLMGELPADHGSFRWVGSVVKSYFPKENSSFFDTDMNLVDWLRQVSKEKEMDEQFIRGWLGKMLFSDEESLKSARVLSGGEKVRCMLSRMMLLQGNAIFTSQDHQFVQTIATRIIELTPKGYIDRTMAFDDYLASDEVKALREKLYK